METAKAWVLAKELDQTFNIVLSKPNYVLYNCRYRKARDSAASVQGDRPLKRRKKTSKPVYNCPAKFIIDKSVVCSCDEVIGSTECQNYCEMVRLRGCTTHSHDLEIRHQRLSKVTKDTLKTLLKSGVPKATILNQYCSSNSFETESKLITMQDLVNLERLDVRGDDNLSEFENVCVEMERKEFRAVSFQGRTHPPIPKVIQSKLIETNGKSMIIYASDTMLDQFRQHPHTLFIVDVTKRKKIPLMTLMVKDAWGEGTPIFHIFGDLESDVLKPALEILYELATEAVESVKVLVSDFTGSFVKVWRESFPNFEIKHVKCELDNAWKKQLLFLHDAKLHHCLKYLGLIPSDGVPVDSDLDPNCEEIDSLEDLNQRGRKAFAVMKQCKKYLESDCPPSIKRCIVEKLEDLGQYISSLSTDYIVPTIEKKRN